jgi:hypothetical protein
MLWLVAALMGGEPWSDRRKLLLSCAMDCAETVRSLWPERSADKIRASVLVLRRWAASQTTAEQAVRAIKELAVVAHVADSTSSAAGRAYQAAQNKADATTDAANQLRHSEYVANLFDKTHGIVGGALQLYYTLSGISEAGRARALAREADDAQAEESAVAAVSCAAVLPCLAADETCKAAKSAVARAAQAESLYDDCEFGQSPAAAWRKVAARCAGIVRRRYGQGPPWALSP